MQTHVVIAELFALFSIRIQSTTYIDRCSIWWPLTAYGVDLILSRKRLSKQPYGIKENLTFIPNLSLASSTSMIQRDTLKY